jgi:hypothetical protein
VSPPADSDGGAVSKNSLSASIRFARDSSMDLTLAGHIKLRAQRNVAVVLAFDNRG